MKFDILKRAGQRAYEEDVRRKPYYPCGDKRRSWDQLSAIAKFSWNKNPAPRSYG